MSSRVCETCQWFVTGVFVGEDGYGICAHSDHMEPFTARHAFMSPSEAAEQIRSEEDWCRDMGGSVPGVSAFECSRCGALLNVGDGGGLRVAGHYYDDTPNVSISYCPNCGARVVSDDDQ